MDVDVELYVKISSPFGHQWRFSIFSYKIDSKVKYFKYFTSRKILARASKRNYQLNIRVWHNKIVFHRMSVCLNTCHLEQKDLIGKGYYPITDIITVIFITIQ